MLNDPEKMKFSNIDNYVGTFILKACSRIHFLSKVTS